MLLPVAALTVAGLLFRVGTLDRQSLWLDELVTRWLVRQDFVEMLQTIPASERTPYLYYVLAWPWARLFGDGEVGMRSLSALVGAATIPVVYAIGARLVSRRAGLVAASLAACNPFLVWYAQEARAYALVALLSALSLLFCAEALEGRRRGLPLWAVTAALAIGTHYFAVFVVAGEVFWLLRRRSTRRRVAFAALLPVVVCVAQGGLLLHQAGGDRGGLADASLPARVLGIAKNAVVGYGFPGEIAGTLAAAALVIVGFVLLATRARAKERRGGTVALSIAACGVVVPVGLALVGADYVIARNAIVVVVPGLVALAAGYAATRLGLVAAAGLCGLSLLILASVATQPLYGRTDWRGAASLIKAGDAGLVAVVTPVISPDLLQGYLPGVDDAEGDVVTREIVSIGLASEGGFGAGAVRPPEPTPQPPPAGFEVVEVGQRTTYTFVRYESERPRRVSLTELQSLRLADESARVFVFPPAAVQATAYDAAGEPPGSCSSGA